MGGKPSALLQFSFYTMTKLLLRPEDRFLLMLSIQESVGG
jgi:hypothetical protein